MKRVLILVIGCSLDPWYKMSGTSLKTWDSVEVDGCETIYYFGKPIKENTDKFIYFPINESYKTMGEKMMCAFEWALENKTFDVIARVNSSCYVDKKQLMKYIETLPDKDLFVGGVVTASENNPQWCWGGLQYIISKDVVQKVVDSKYYLDDTLMEDQALSYLATKCGVEFTSAKGACSIDKTNGGWNLISYGGESITFVEFNSVKRLGHHFYRCKQDLDRNLDEYVMNELYNVLK